MSPVTEASWAGEPLPPWAPSSISFFALSQAPPPAVIEIAAKRPTTMTPISRPPSASTLSRPTITGTTIGISAGRIISFCAAAVTIATVFAVVGFFGALHDPRVLAELLAHLFDDLAAGAADRLDREGGEQVDHHAADDQPDQHVGRGQVEEAVEVESGGRFVGEFALEGGEQHQRGERGGADRVTLGDRLGRVADRVERVGDVANVLGQVGHLGDPAGVVGDRPEGVEGDDQAAERELRHHGDADAVDPGELVGAEDRQREHQRRGGGRLEALGEPLDDVRRVARSPRPAAIDFTGRKRVDV